MPHTNIPHMSIWTISFLHNLLVNQVWKNINISKCCKQKKHIGYINFPQCICILNVSQCINFPRQPVAEVLAYLHVQISPISCNVVGSIMHVLGKNTDTAIVGYRWTRVGDTRPCTVNWCKKSSGCLISFELLYGL